MRARRHRLADLGQMPRHGRRVAIRQDKARALALLWADGAEDVGPSGALVARGCGPAAASRPAPSDLVLLPDPGLIMPPHFYLGARRERGSDRRHSGGEVF